MDIIKRFFIFYFFILNLIGFLSMFMDKEKAKKGKWRIRESTLLLLSVMGGSIGSYLGMMFFRHKTKHNKFKYGIPIIILIQLIFVLYLLNC
ncbi:DUF1294 domain-containing protein [Haloimpatiens sp. FM7315]|uniref:DUF1294 domain-containing protein n=1 Tax=Haloimpatiens sp. FM7315 TaxID=3298609 RepID=UPI003709FF8B